MAFTKQQLMDMYRLRAAWYDFTANLYYLFGFREAYYRTLAVAALHLKPGDTVVEIGCGTGLNISRLHSAVGDGGRVIGVDLTDAMLEQAARRIENHGWQNITLTQADAASYDFPSGVQGVISTFALTLVPEYEQVMVRAEQALAPKGRFVLLDLKQPTGWPLWIVRLGVAASRPFGVTLDLAQRKPWEAMYRIFAKVTLSELYAGFVFLAVGEKQGAGANVGGTA